MKQKIKELISLVPKNQLDNMIDTIQDDDELLLYTLKVSNLTEHQIRIIIGKLLSRNSVEKIKKDILEMSPKIKRLFMDEI